MPYSYSYTEISYEFAIYMGEMIIGVRWNEGTINVVFSFWFGWCVFFYLIDDDGSWRMRIVFLSRQELCSSPSVQSMIR